MFAQLSAKRSFLVYSHKAWYSSHFVAPHPSPCHPCTISVPPEFKLVYTDPMRAEKDLLNSSHHTTMRSPPSLPSTSPRPITSCSSEIVITRLILITQHWRQPSSSGRAHGTRIPTPIRTRPNIKELSTRHTLQLRRQQVSRTAISATLLRTAPPHVRSMIQ